MRVDARQIYVRFVSVRICDRQGLTGQRRRFDCIMRVDARQIYVRFVSVRICDRQSLTGQRRRFDCVVRVRIYNSRRNLVAINLDAISSRIGLALRHGIGCAVDADGREFSVGVIGGSDSGARCQGKFIGNCRAVIADLADFDAYIFTTCAAGAGEGDRAGHHLAAFRISFCVECIINFETDGTTVIAGCLRLDALYIVALAFFDIGADIVENLIEFADLHLADGGGGVLDFCSPIAVVLASVLVISSL